MLQMMCKTYGQGSVYNRKGEDGPILAKYMIFVYSIYCQLI